MKETFKRRAMQRSLVSYVFLLLGVIVIIFGVVLIIMQLDSIADSEQENIYSILNRLAFIVFVTFVAQVLFRLYKYNMLKADYFLACADALTLRSEVKSEEDKKLLEGLVGLFFAEGITLSTPATPKIPFVPVVKDGVKSEV